MTEFTPLSALLGGAIIGIAAALLLLLIGKTAGISGIVGDALKQKTWRISWQMMFIIGLILAPLMISPVFDALPDSINVGWWEIIIGGFLVGFGARLGSGCTSGHGICGIGRFSKRSIIATLLFMFSAVITVYIQRHIIGA
ncbi:YeeE/YedE family protein [Thalassotalea maritima]|uniref:YeeE/YedE family protein n=1 Tax=Thalassotalea maritima TaxID=3242416 RepID=UPI003526F06C